MRPAAGFRNQSYGAELDERWRAGERILQRATVTVGRRTLAYVATGQGDRPCVLLHGIGNTWRFWTAVLPDLAKGRRVIAFDVPGFGDSDPPPGRFDADSVADVLLAGCALLGIDRASWCGHSLGALVALTSARRAPDRVDRVAVIGGALATILRFYAQPASILAHPLTAATYACSVMSGAVPVPGRVLDAIARSTTLRSLVLAPYLRHPAGLPAGPIRACLEGVGRRGVLRAALNAGDFNLEHTAKAVAQPVLLVNGDADRLSLVGDVDRLAGWLPHPAVEVLEDTGHWPMIERPAVVGPLLDVFLKG